MRIEEDIFRRFNIFRKTLDEKLKKFAKKNEPLNP